MIKNKTITFEVDNSPAIFNHNYELKEKTELIIYEKYLIVNTKPIKGLETKVMPDNKFIQLLKPGLWEVEEPITCSWGPLSWANSLNPLQFNRDVLDPGRYVVWPALDNYFYIQKIEKSLKVEYPTMIDITAELLHRYIFTKYAYLTIDDTDCIKMNTNRILNYYELCHTK